MRELTGHSYDRSSSDLYLSWLGQPDQKPEVWRVRKSTMVEGNILLRHLNELYPTSGRSHSSSALQTLLNLSIIYYKHCLVYVSICKYM